MVEVMSRESSPFKAPGAEGQEMVFKVQLIGPGGLGEVLDLIDG